MYRLNEEPFHVDLMRSTEILARIETVDSVEYSDEIDGDFTCTIVVRGTIELRPSGISTSDAVGIVLGAILEADASDSETETSDSEKDIVFIPGWGEEE